MSRLVVLISGNGSNLQAILDACKDGRLEAHVMAVLSNNPQAHGLERARQAGVPAHAIEWADTDRKLYDAQLADAVAAYRPNWVVLAGWMRLLSMEFLERFPNQVINLHPALPGQFPGLRAIERAYQAFQRGEINETGVMIHTVPDEGVDCGPVLAQQSLTIEPDETLESLQERIHALEHELLIKTLEGLTGP